VNPYYGDDLISLHHGDALAVSVTLPSSSVQTIVTSPPYFGLRDYGEDGQIGAENSVTGYIESLVSLFAELRRVLVDDGTLWLNLGDSYSSALSGNSPTNTRNKGGHAKRSKVDGLAAKNLIGVPWRVALALQADGWILRSDIIWQKPNPMPESVTDRPTKSHEYLFLFAKKPKYYYDAASIAEPMSDSNAQRTTAHYDTSVKYGAGNGGNGGLDSLAARMRAGGVTDKNKRSVWTVPTVQFPGAHFAVYPPDLIRPCILAGSRPGDTVLDPFSGSGTTGMVATQEGRKYVGIDLNKDYLDLSLSARFQSPPLNFGDGAA